MFEKRNHKEEFRQYEGEAFIKEHKEKTFKTLEVLMTNLNMNYFWIRIRFFFAKREPILEELQKLFNRCLKLYACINDMMKIFKLIDKFRKSRGKEDLENATEY